jgi:putative Holliday junction resolvase
LGRVAALDPGTKRIGVAVSDSQWSFAFPRDAWPADGDIEKLAQSLVDEENVDILVVGRPISLAGRETASTEDADFFAERVTRAVNIPVERMDERLTTVTASQHLRESGFSGSEQRRRVDSAAACVILESWLEARR